MKVVSPYRPFAPESASHRTLGPFDWPAAIAMLRQSVAVSCGCETVTLTDLETPLSGPTYRYPTTQTRLMLWILEVSLAYLRSADFDDDTVFLSPDSMVRGDLAPYFGGDLTILVRSHAKYAKRPILNAAQWWPVSARDRLIPFYESAVRVAYGLPDNLVTWGADSEALRRLIAPIVVGCQPRGGVLVHQIEARLVMYAMSRELVNRLEAGETMQGVPQPIIDFKGQRKRLMARYVAATGGR
jgi:hypothetical protein